MKDAIKPATIVITPRDRYSSLAQCIVDLYEYTDESLFDLIVLNLGYPQKDWDAGIRELADRDNYRVFDYGSIIPMAAMDQVRKEIQTPYAVFMDNDSRALPGWLPPLIASANSTQAAVVYPVTLERSGVDAGADVRTHLWTTELRVVDVEKTPFLIEHKTFRRALPEDLPAESAESQAFELHCVMFNTEVLKTLELPRMTIREHLDIGLQIRSRGLKLLVEPSSHIVFDNLGTRANLSDLKYFNLRWNTHITEQSSRLFEKRWGYSFYSEKSIYNWARRRRRFLIMRWLYLPIPVANFLDKIVSAIQRRVRPIWDPLDDPDGNSRPLYDGKSDSVPKQLNHSLQ